MSRRTYPRIGEIKRYNGSRMCKACGIITKPCKRVDIQVNWFRGDDEVFYVCDTCARREDLLTVLIMKEQEQ